MYYILEYKKIIKSVMIDIANKQINICWEFLMNYQPAISIGKEVEVAIRIVPILYVQQ